MINFAAIITTLRTEHGLDCHCDHQSLRQLTPDERDVWLRVILHSVTYNLISPADRHTALTILNSLTAAPHCDVIALAYLITQLCDRLGPILEARS